MAISTLGQTWNKGDWTEKKEILIDNMTKLKAKYFRSEEKLKITWMEVPELWRSIPHFILHYVLSRDKHEHMEIVINCH